MQGWGEQEREAKPQGGWGEASAGVKGEAERSGSGRWVGKASLWWGDVDRKGWVRVLVAHHVGVVTNLCVTYGLRPRGWVQQCCLPWCGKAQRVMDAAPWLHPAERGQ